jgi:imidazolonepropionase
MNLACVDLRLSMSESLIASTINSAFALGVEDQRGSIELGKRADFIIINSARLLLSKKYFISFFFY